MIERAYVDPYTLVGPSVDEVLPIRVINLRKNDVPADEESSFLAGENLEEVQ